MDLKTITVLWMDDRTETYLDVQTSVRDDVLHVFQYKKDTVRLTAEWHLPLCNIRGWWPADQSPPQWIGDQA